jgi:hypothetical protein
MTKLGDYLNAVNHTKVPLLDTDDESIEKGYVPFVMNRCLSYFPDTIFYVNEMNIRPDTSKKMQFDFYLHSLRKRKRFSKWLKRENPDDLQAVMDYFEYSEAKAREALNVLPKETVLEIVDMMSKRDG